MKSNSLFKFLCLASLIANVLLAMALYKANASVPTAEESSTEPEVQAFGVTDEIYFIGNSIIRPVDWAKMLGNPFIVNQAVAGITSTDAVMMSNELVPQRPAEIWIMLGINDIKSGMPPELTIRNLSHFVYTIERMSSRTEIRLLSVLPVNEELIKYEIRNEQVQMLNEMIQSFCTKLDFEYIDLYKVLLGADANLDKSYTTDGLHLSDAGYLALGKALRAKKIGEER